MVVIKSPDKNIFEEAIFIVREDALHKGVTREEIIREAQEVANEYISSKRKRSRWSMIPGYIYALIGAGALAMLYWVAQLL